MVEEGKEISSSVHRNESTLTVPKELCVTSQKKKSVELYEMPKHFATFGCMIKHWYQVVKEKENTSNKTWRKHLSGGDKRRFQRFARVIRAYKTVLNTGMQVTDAENKFDAYYQENKQSLAKLSDKFALEFLK